MNKKPTNQAKSNIPKYKQLYFRSRRNDATPPALQVIGDSVRMFYNVMEKLRLMNPKTGLNARKYGLVILHEYSFIYLDKEKGEMTTRIGTLYASITRESFEEYFQVDEKNRVEAKVNIPLIAFHHAFFIDNVSENEEGGKHKDRVVFSCIRSIQGQKHLQFVKIPCLGIGYIADKIASTVFKLDYMTDDQAASATQEVIERAKTKPQQARLPSRLGHATRNHKADSKTAGTKPEKQL
jgi:hypothetical protein